MIYCAFFDAYFIIPVGRRPQDAHMHRTERTICFANRAQVSQRLVLSLSK